MPPKACFVPGRAARPLTPGGCCSGHSPSLCGQRLPNSENCCSPISPPPSHSCEFPKRTNFLRAMQPFVLDSSEDAAPRVTTTREAWSKRPPLGVLWDLHSLVSQFSRWGGSRKCSGLSEKRASGQNCEYQRGGHQRTGKLWSRQLSKGSFMEPQLTWGSN